MTENKACPVPLSEALRVNSVTSNTYKANLLDDYCYGSGKYESDSPPENNFSELSYSLLIIPVPQPFMEDIWPP